MSPLALVTGASSGIGKAFAQRLAANGNDLVIVGRRRERLEELAASLAGVRVQVVAADLATEDGIEAVAELCASQPLTMLVNNAGVAHYMPMVDLSAEKARELVRVKVLAPTMLTRAALAGMISRGTGTILNVAGMIAFSGPAPPSPPQGQRAIYAGTLVSAVAMSQTLAAELTGTGVKVHVVWPGLVATEFHEVQGMDLSAIPRMSPEDVVSAALTGIELGEVVSAPGVEDYSLLDAVFRANLAAFHGQSPQLATDTTRSESARGDLSHVRIPRLRAEPVEISMDLTAKTVGDRSSSELASLSLLNLQKCRFPIVLHVFEPQSAEFAERHAGSKEDLDRKKRPTSRCRREQGRHLSGGEGLHLLDRDFGARTSKRAGSTA